MLEILYLCEQRMEEIPKLSSELLLEQRSLNMYFYISENRDINLTIIIKAVKYYLRWS